MNPARPSGAPIFHLTTLEAWQAAVAAGEYRVSTHGLTLDEVGFIHAAHADQVAGVYADFFAHLDEALVVLEINPDRLGCPVLEEAVGDRRFPHIYGPLPIGAVTGVTGVGEWGLDQCSG